MQKFTKGCKIVRMVSKQQNKKTISVSFSSVQECFNAPTTPFQALFFPGTATLRKKVRKFNPCVWRFTIKFFTLLMMVDVCTVEHWSK